MAFQILPAIDVAGGRIVSVSAGQVREVEAFGGSPLAAARAFVAAGATWLHVVDVDRADGRPGDLRLLGSLARVGARVQASGGIASEAAAADALAAGAARIVLSSAILTDRELTARTVSEVGERAVVGIEADGETIEPRASGARALPLAETLAWVRTLDPAGFLYTSLSRVAHLTGPDVETLTRVAQALGRPVTAAGGIATPDDVRALRAAGSAIVDGCVIGRALYEGLDLRAVLLDG